MKTAVPITSEWASSAMPVRRHDSNKSDHGWLLAVAGCDAMPGAAILSIVAAYRAGIGRATLASTPAVLSAVAHHMPEALQMPLPTQTGAIDSRGAQAVLGYAVKTSAGVFGPGLGESKSTDDFLSTVWAEWSKPCVVDADGLNAASRGVRLPRAETVLTPHSAEMARLLGTTFEEVEADRRSAVSMAAGRFRCVVVLKGAESLVSDVEGNLAVNTSGNSGMASAGMGDVLSGVIGALLAQGLSPFDAARLGVFWHGASADLAAERIGSVGFTAGDVARLLPMARDRLIGHERKEGAVRP